MTFTRPISEIGKEPLQASFEISIASTLSRLDLRTDHIWLVNGRKAASPEVGSWAQYSTRLLGEAIIDPGAFSYQYEFTERSGPILAEGVALSSELVRQLVACLESAQILVKNVTQNEPVTEHLAEALQKHSWDILGRTYVELFPIDVHVNVAGYRPLRDEDYESDRNKSKTTLELYLRALVTNKNQTQIEKFTTSKCRELSNVLASTLNQPS